MNYVFRKTQEERTVYATNGELTVQKKNQIVQWKKLTGYKVERLVYGKIMKSLIGKKSVMWPSGRVKENISVVSPSTFCSPQLLHCSCYAS